MTIACVPPWMKAASKFNMSCLDSCLDLIRLQRAADAARDELRHADPASVPTFDDDVVRSTLDRVVRTAVFSADIDVLFHKAKCPVCKQSTVLSTSSSQYQTDAA